MEPAYSAIFLPSSVSLAEQFTLRTSKMKLTIFISLLLVFLGQLITVNGAQLALRSRSKEQLLSRSISLSRSIASNDAIFDPTNEESFYLVGGEIA